jgi:ribonuclease HII
MPCDRCWKTVPEPAWRARCRALSRGAYVAGVDEVGRGPLVGDVVAAAVILGPALAGEAFCDSKAISAPRREELAQRIRTHALCVGLGRASPEEIDRLNILRATLLAMRRAVADLDHTPALVLVDGNRLPDWDYPSEAVVRGDAQVPEIGAASIIAKVQRDAEMRALDARYPGYGMAAHKGYPTPAHLEALARLGPTPCHRRSFRPVRELIERGGNRGG